MIKLTFNQTRIPLLITDTYDDDYIIPFSKTVGEYNSFPNTLYCRNISGQNFIELRFNKESNDLFEVTVVSFEEENVQILNPLLINILPNFFVCKIIENESICENGLSTTVYETEESFLFIFDNTDIGNIIYHKLGDSLSLGVCKNNFLKSILFKKT